MNIPNHVTSSCNYSSITVIGGGKSGRALALLGKRLGMSVFLSDMSPITSEARSVLQYHGIPWEEKHTEKILEQDAVILSSGISPSSSVVSMAQKAKVPLLGELDFVTPHIKGDLLGVTGSNGKSTTVALLAHILQKSFGEEKITSGGNIGIPLGELALKDYSCIVAELSSFQLHWAHSPCLMGGGITNLVPDHLDWHGGYDSYVKAKKNILSLLKNNLSPFFVFRGEDMAYFSKEDFYSFVHAFPFYWEQDEKNSQKLNKGVFATSQGVVLRKENEEIFLFNPTKDFPLLGKHNIENAAFAASLAFLWRTKDPSLNMREGIRSFSSLPHRCENLGTKGGVTFVNDSKGTNVAATITALESLEGDIIILLGGKGKGEQYHKLAEAVSRNAREAILFGAEAPFLGKALQEKVSHLSVVPDLEKAFLRALELSRENDTILLSPACTSWDAYRSYTERGDHFRSLVEKTSFDPQQNKLAILP